MKHRLPLAAVLLLAASARAADDPGAGAYLDALSSLSGGQYAEAEKSLTQAIAASEENPAYYQARGVARALQENFSAALSDFQRSARLASAKDWETAAWSAITNKLNNNLDTPFAPGTAPRADVDYAVALNALAQNYWQSRYKGSYNDPVQKKTVQTTEPYKGDFPKIAALYAQRHMGSAAVDPKALLARVQSQMDAGQYLQALGSLNPSLAAAPGNADLLELKAKILLALNDPQDARALYTDLLTRRATAAVYIGRARAAALMGDPSRVTKDLAQAAKLDPAQTAAAQRQITIPPAPPALAAVIALWNTLESQCAANSPQAPTTALAIVRGMAADRIRYDEHYQERLAALESNLKAAPNDPDRMVALARFLHDESSILEEHVGPRADPKPYRTQSPNDLQRDLDRADALLDTALRQHPDNLAALTLKAHLLILAADYDDAQTVVTKALAQKKDDPDLLECLASLLQIQAARHISEAGNLRLPKTWYEVHFDEYPPREYKYTIYPSKAELQQAAELERQAEQLSKLAEERLNQAVQGAGPTALGWYYRATLQRVRGDSAGAKESMTKAVNLQPDFQQAWFQLASLCTDLLDGDGAVAARARAYNLAQTTAAAELNALWYKIPHNQFKTARDSVIEGVRLDPADPRLPAYLAVIDEAAEKPADALTHYRMAKALADAGLALAGTAFAPPREKALALPAQEAPFSAMVRLRIAALLFDAGKTADAAIEFAAVSAALAPFPPVDPARPAPDALLPNPDLSPGTVPLPEPLAFLQIRAAAGTAYATWAIAHKDNAAFAAQTYRRLLVIYPLNTDSLDAMHAVADLGLAELFLRSNQFQEATAALKSTPAVPQDLWQEMRRTETAAQSQRPSP